MEWAKTTARRDEKQLNASYFRSLRYTFDCEDIERSTATVITLLQDYRAHLRSLAPGKFEWNFRYLILQIISVIDGWGISCELAFRWMSLDLTDDKSTLVQVMVWCHQATIHYLRQCWPRSLSPYGVTRPQWVKTTFSWGHSERHDHYSDAINISTATSRNIDIFYNSEFSLSDRC